MTSTPVRLLLIRDPSGEERVMPLEGEQLTLGRDPSCTICFESSYVSRQHARIRVDADGPVLVDLGSHNGSLLNGVRINGEARLNVGDVITLADATVTCLAQPASGRTTRTLGVPVVDAPALGDRLRVDAQTYQVWLGDRPLERRLSAQEFQLLAYLYERRDRVCTRQELGRAIWGDGNWNPNMLHRLVRRVKEKLEPDPERPRYVQTLPWIGYRLAS